MTYRSGNLIRPGVVLLAIGLVAVVGAGIAGALIKVVGYGAIALGVLCVVVGIVRGNTQGRRPRAPKLT